ncbi:Arc family DNA-binding protein [Morganella morganii]|uniref:Arc family DNA-binding protein n=1 Tax=Morganella morganii TaxID=582 RepID=UPI00069AB52F|nr:Arc family DNA-binding protein [Morganella morganii]KNZ83874.1 hypothetical protein AKG16_19005 [Morganella morganii]
MTTRRNPQFNVRIPPELKERVVALAEKNKRPVNAEINAALEAWVDIGSGALPAESIVDLSRQIEELKNLIEVKTKLVISSNADE